MKTIQTKLETDAVFSDDGSKRYLLKKLWDDKKPSMTIIMLAPSDASGIALDNTTLLVLNNASRLGYGSVSIVNLFATLNDFTLSNTEPEDPVNLSMILEEAKRSDVVVYAPGVGKARNPVFQERAAQVLSALRPVAKKLRCLTSKDGSARLMHPLTPAMREWVLADVSIEEALQTAPVEEARAKKPVGRPRKNPVRDTAAL